MIGDIYSHYIPHRCPKCNEFWKLQGHHGMTAILLKDCVSIECNNCKSSFIIQFDEHGKPIKQTN